MSSVLAFVAALWLSVTALFVSPGVSTEVVPAVEEHPTFSEIMVADKEIRPESSTPANEEITPAPLGVASLIASPAKGTIPLSVTLTATVNVERSCDARNYALHFDENFPAGESVADITVPKGWCAPKTVAVVHEYTHCGQEAGKPYGTCMPAVFERLGNGQTRRDSSALVTLAPKSGDDVAEKREGTTPRAAGSAKSAVDIRFAPLHNPTTLGFFTPRAPYSCGDYKIDVLQGGVPLQWTGMYEVKDTDSGECMFVMVSVCTGRSVELKESGVLVGATTTPIICGWEE